MAEKTITVTQDDADRIAGIAGELEHLPAEIRRHLDQDGRDARYLRLLEKRIRAALASPSTGSEQDQGEQATEELAGLQMLFRFGGRKVEGTYLIKWRNGIYRFEDAPVGLRYHWDQAVANAQRTQSGFVFQPNRALVPRQPEQNQVTSGVGGESGAAEVRRLREAISSHRKQVVAAALPLNTSRQIAADNELWAALDATPEPQQEVGAGELDRYRLIFGDLCWMCGGSGEVPGELHDDTSGGLMICPDCDGSGKKPEEERPDPAEIPLPATQPPASSKGGKRMSGIVPREQLKADQHQAALHRLAAVSQYLYDTMAGDAQSERPEPLPLLAMEKVREAQAAIDAAIKNGQRTRRSCLGGELRLEENWRPEHLAAPAQLDQPEAGCN